MYYGLKQGQITPNIDNKYVLKRIHFVAQCSKITNTALFLKRILHHCSAFCCFLLVILECPKVQYRTLSYQSINSNNSSIGLSVYKIYVIFLCIPPYFCVIFI